MLEFCKRQLASVIDQASSPYLRKAITFSPLTPLLCCAVLYIFGTSEMWSTPFSILLILGVLLLVGAPRWSCYVALSLALLTLTFVLVFTVATGPGDVISDRDEQLEIGARAFLRGENPWRQPIPSGNPMSCGPSSVLIAVPFVALTDRIQELTYLFYVALFAFLLAGDIRKRNDSFLLLGLLFMTGVFGFHHTLFLALDDLYFGYLALALAWIMARRDRAFAAGVCLAVAGAVRLSYGFPVAAFIFWFLHVTRYERGALWKLVGGIVTGAATIAAAFIIVVGPDVVERNTASYNMLAQGWPRNNALFSAMDSALGSILEFGPAGVYVASLLKVALALAALWLLCRAISKRLSTHPFWHVCAGGFVSTMAVYIPDIYLDYMPFFVIPGLMAIAHTESRWPFSSGGDPPPKEPNRLIE